MAKETTVEKFTVIIGDPNSFHKEYSNFKSKNTILKDAISTQVIQVPNKAFGQVIGQPQMMTSALVSAAIFYTEGKNEEEEKKK